jgi:inosose dehydratase
MSTVSPPRLDPRPSMRRPDDALPGASIGTAPMLWANADGAPRDGTDAMAILDEIARVGYEGTQLGDGFPEGGVLRDALRERGIRLAEVYVPIPATVDGPVADALDIAEERLRLLHDGEGDVLCLAIDGSADRDAAAGRADEPGTPVLTDAGWDSLVSLLNAIADRASALGHPVVFHPHGGTFIETPAEVARLAAATDPERMGICLDVGHYLVGGGDPVMAIRALGRRVTHIHLKDVDPAVLTRLHSGALDGLGQGIRERIFTELGAGMLDLDGVIAALRALDYSGWLIVEQDTTWAPPSESAAIGRRVLASALRRLGAPDRAGVAGART